MARCLELIILEDGFVPSCGVLIGLASNVGLTATKGIAGIYMNSASLLAEAGHSLSDLLGVSPGVQSLTRFSTSGTDIG